MSIKQPNPYPINTFVRIVRHNDNRIGQVVAVNGQDRVILVDGNKKETWGVWCLAIDMETSRMGQKWRVARAAKIGNKNA